MKKPEPWDFGLTSDEYRRYSKRAAPFDFEKLFRGPIIVPTTVAVVAIAAIAQYVHTQDLLSAGAVVVVGFFLGVIPAILLLLLVSPIVLGVYALTSWLSKYYLNWRLSNSMRWRT